MSLTTRLLDRAHPAQVWSDKYWRKKGHNKHSPEDKRLCQLAFTQIGVRDMVNKTLGYDRQYLDPPHEFRYEKLQNLLLNANFNALAPYSTDTGRTILLDERKDPNSVLGATRDWGDDGEHGYFRQPPKGIEDSIFFRQLSARDFVQRLNGNTVRSESL
jgi:hypothetical protein